MISPALSPRNGKACRVRNWTLDSIFSRTWWLTDFSAECSLKNVSPTSSLHVGRTRVRSTASLWPFDNSWPSKSLPSQAVSFRNLLWLNSVFGDAISVVYPYTYMAKCAITGLAVMVHGCATNQSFWRDHSFCYFLLAEFTRRTFFLQLKRLVTELRNFVESWNNGDCWYCCCRRWSNGDCWCCSWLQLFLLEHLSNVLGVLSSSIWVDFT